MTKFNMPNQILHTFNYIHKIILKLKLFHQITIKNKKTKHYKIIDTYKIIKI